MEVIFYQRRLRELKYREISTTGHVPELPKAGHGDYDSRVLNSDLQRVVAGDCDE
jgi:hypothetical protein